MEPSAKSKNPPAEKDITSLTQPEENPKPVKKKKITNKDGYSVEQRLKKMPEGESTVGFIMEYEIDGDRITAWSSAKTYDSARSTIYQKKATAEKRKGYKVKLAIYRVEPMSYQDFLNREKEEKE